jgi:hypothetical protein
MVIARCKYNVAAAQALSDHPEIMLPLEGLKQNRMQMIEDSVTNHRTIEVTKSRN